MDLTPYLEALRRDLAASAAPGGPEVSRAAELLAGSLEASARLCLMEALADAADEVTTKLGTASVEVRLRGREADLVVTEITHPEPEPAPPAPPPAAAPTADGSGDVARITLRLPEGLKESVERAASAEGISVNAWLVRAIAAAVSGRPSQPPPSPSFPPFPPGRASFGKRVTGFAQA
ncbi:MAG TPA: toxin-antitoxin system HicB family antitoxin [Natronosporangium sp.]